MMGIITAKAQRSVPSVFQGAVHMQMWVEQNRVGGGRGQRCVLNSLHHLLAHNHRKLNPQVSRGIQGFFLWPIYLPRFLEE